MSVANCKDFGADLARHFMTAQIAGQLFGLPLRWMDTDSDHVEPVLFFSFPEKGGGRNG